MPEVLKVAVEHHVLLLIFLLPVVQPFLFLYFHDLHHILGCSFLDGLVDVWPVPFFFAYGLVGIFHIATAYFSYPFSNFGIDLGFSFAVCPSGSSLSILDHCFELSFIQFTGHA